MRTLLLATVAVAAAMITPASALAAESAWVASGTLTYTSAAGQVDAVTVGHGTGAYAGRHFLTESASPSGTVGAGCTPLTGYPTVVCDGVTAFDLTTLDQNDVVYVLSDLPARIDPGAGSDDVHAGSGDDRIFARDGAKDTIDCGPGDDRAETDAVDVVTNCEADPAIVVVEPEPETPADETPKSETPKGDTPKGDTPEADGPKADRPAADAGRRADTGTPELPALPGASPVSLVAGPVQVRNGAAPIELSCAATEVAGCSGGVFLDPAPQGKAKGHAKGKKAKVRAVLARRGRFGRSPFQIAPGKTQSVSVRLTGMARNRLGLPKAAKGARAARRGRRVKAKVTVVQKGKKPVAVVVELRG